MEQYELMFAEYNELMNQVFPRVCDDIISRFQNIERSTSSHLNRISDLARHLLTYNVRGGKMIRAFLFLSTYNALHQCDRTPLLAKINYSADPDEPISLNESNAEISNDHLKLCKRHINADKQIELLMLAWSIEFLQASFLVADDIMDFSPVRRGKPSWYMVVAERNRRRPSEDDVMAGLAAINDVFLLLYSSFNVVDQYYRGSVHKRLTEVLHDALLKTTIGQSIDMDHGTNSDSAADGIIQIKLNLDDRDKVKDILEAMTQRYFCTVNYKTSYYSFHLPIMMACILVDEERKERNKKHVKQESTTQSFMASWFSKLWYKGSEQDEEPQSTTKNDCFLDMEIMSELAMQMGTMFQIRDDMLDWCEELADSKKSLFTDISEGKLTWPFITCLKELNKHGCKDNLILICDTYGKESNDPTHYVVADIYEQMNIKDIYLSEMETRRNQFNDCLQRLYSTNSLKLTLLTYVNFFTKTTA